MHNYASRETCQDCLRPRQRASATSAVRYVPFRRTRRNQSAQLFRLSSGSLTARADSVGESLARDGGPLPRDESVCPRKRTRDESIRLWATSAGYIINNNCYTTSPTPRIHMTDDDVYSTKPPAGLLCQFGSAHRRVVRNAGGFRTTPFIQASEETTASSPSYVSSTEIGPHCSETSRRSYGPVRRNDSTAAGGLN